MYKKPILLICFVLVLGLVLTSTVQAVDPSLAGWWKFDGDALDSSGNNRHGTLYGAPVFVLGVFDQALDTSQDPGNPEYVAITGYKGILGSNPFSITAWIKTTDGGGVIVAWGRHHTGADANRLEFRTNNNRLRVEHGSGNLQGDSTAVTDNEWHHVAVTHAQGGTLQQPDTKIYLDGEDDTRLTTGDGSITNFTENTFDLTIARRHSEAGRWFDALIDEVRIYERELSQADVQADMLGEGLPHARMPDPEDGATGVPVDANLAWTRGDGALWDYVYFGTDPCDMNLPQVDTLQVGVDDPLYDPPGDLIASTTYYWYITEVNSPNEYPGPLWSFSTIRGKATPKDPVDGEEIEGEPYPDDPPYTHIWTRLIFNPGPTAVKHTGYFSDDYSKVYTRHQDANLGSPPYPYPGWEYIYFAGNPEVDPAIG
ncbi:MAG: LamG domain-containing protein [Planctomycetota bacterium]|jgi:hypothetical protein